MLPGNSGIRTAPNTFRTGSIEACFDCTYTMSGINCCNTKHHFFRMTNLDLPGLAPQAAQSRFAMWSLSVHDESDLAET